MPWKSPDSYEEPTSQWFDETNAYDGDTETKATNDPLPPKGQWGQHLILLFSSAVICDRIRYWVDGYHVEQVKIEAYYENDWHIVFEGYTLKSLWVTKKLEDMKSVSKLRVQLQNYSPAEAKGYLNELQVLETGNFAAGT